MTSYLIDITWYDQINGQGNSSLLFCRMTMLGLLRLLTNRAVMGDSTVTLDNALAIYDQWIRDPRVELAAEPLGIDKQFRQALRPVSGQPATKAIADCYLVGFASGRGSRKTESLCSSDTPGLIRVGHQTG
jgi:hypothetical protein